MTVTIDVLECSSTAITLKRNGWSQILSGLIEAWMLAVDQYVNGRVVPLRLNDFLAVEDNRAVVTHYCGWIELLRSDTLSGLVVMKSNIMRSSINGCGLKIQVITHHFHHRTLLTKHSRYHRLWEDVNNASWFRATWTLTTTFWPFGFQHTIFHSLNLIL